MYVDSQSSSVTAGTPYTIVASYPSAPVEFPLNSATFNITLTYMRPFLAYLKVPALSLSTYTNLTMEYQVFSSYNLDQLQIEASSSIWPGPRNSIYDGSYSVNSQTGKNTRTLQPCLLDYTEKAVYFWFNYDSASQRYSYAAAAAGTLQIQVGLRFTYEATVPVNVSAGALFTPTKALTTFVPNLFIHAFFLPH